MLSLESKEMRQEFHFLWDVEIDGNFIIWIQELIGRFSELSGIEFSAQAISGLRIGTPMYASKKTKTKGRIYKIGKKYKKPFLQNF